MGANEEIVKEPKTLHLDADIVNDEANEYIAQLDESVEHNDPEEQETGEIRVTRLGTLSTFIKNQVDSRISTKAKLLLMDQLEQLTIIMIKRADEYSKIRGRQTIYDVDLESAYEELLQPHVFVDQVVQTLEKQKEELQILAKSSLLRHMEVE
ncbi:hypothetical protein [Neobacillus sp. SuZ13]|uniref:hypothetical protein n=1 Tax=Neobacillus sp. SuZ13 TaxID=3047875 RepID=UPI0024C08244|nr:hypothetical protein [Neobacillus sp. SuZ13]WHY65367.1 hypothetical protein QNH17_20045 [Neobacillus sp. SuZ13]